jgi:MYXO-CTERM domain-containing protein
MMSYADVKAISPCLKTQCQATCEIEVGLTLWPAAVCSADPPPSGAGTGGSGGGQGGQAGLAGSGGGQGGQAGQGAGAAGAGGTGGELPKKKGGCDVAAAPGAGPELLWVAALLLAAARRRRARGY